MSYRAGGKKFTEPGAVSMPQYKEPFLKHMFDMWSRAGESIPVSIEDFLNMPPLTTAKVFDTKHPHSGFASYRQESLKGQGRSLRMPMNNKKVNLIYLIFTQQDAVNEVSH